MVTLGGETLSLLPPDPPHFLATGSEHGAISGFLPQLSAGLPITAWGARDACRASSPSCCSHMESRSEGSLRSTSNLYMSFSVKEVGQCIVCTSLAAPIHCKAFPGTAAILSMLFRE